MEIAWLMLLALCVIVPQCNTQKTMEDGLRFKRMAKHHRRGSPESNSVTWRKTAQANRHFAHRLYGNIARQHETGNVMISPFVVTTGLSMTLLGAKGETEREIMKTLDYSNLLRKKNGMVYTKDDVPRFYQRIERSRTNVPDGQHAFTVACRLFGDQSETFLPKFISDTERIYRAKLEEMDFVRHPEQARRHINEWVSNKTEGAITEALPAGTVSSATLLTLVSTAFFKGEWKHKFDPDKTQPREFTSQNGTTGMANFMEGKFRLNYKFSTKLNCDIVILPYKSASPEYSVEMELFLPRKSRGLSDIEQSGETEFHRALKNLREVEMILKLPKFRIDFEIDLRETLQTLGIRTLFGTADLSGMNGKYNLNLGNAIHKTYVEVDEEGTKAASSLGMSMNKAVVMELNFNRPFVFIIREKSTNTVLFMGRVDRPT